MYKIQKRPAAAAASAAASSSGTAACSGVAASPLIPCQSASNPSAYPMVSRFIGSVGSCSTQPSVRGTGSSASSVHDTSSVASSGLSSSANDVDLAAAAAALGLLSPPPGYNVAAYSKMRLVEKLVLDLTQIDRRENALLLLSKKHKVFQDLAPLLWFSFGTITILLQEVIAIYPMLSPPSLTLAQSKRVCNAIVLLQCVASHPDTRKFLVQAMIPSYLYTFLETYSESEPFEHLRAASLGLIVALVKFEDPDAVDFLLDSEIMPMLLCAVESGGVYSRTAATFIVQRILQDDLGLKYVCYKTERQYALSRALATAVAGPAQPSEWLLKNVITCYICLSRDKRSIKVLRYFLPKILVTGIFDKLLQEDQTMRMWLQQLLDNV